MLPPCAYPIEPRDRELWAVHFRQTEPAVSAFIDHIEENAGQKLAPHQLSHLLSPVLRVLIDGERVKLGPNFKDIT